MTVSDAMLALLLSARIHGTENALRTTAKRCAQRLPRSKRFLMFNIIESRSPMDLLAVLVGDWQQWHDQQSASTDDARRFA